MKSSIILEFSDVRLSLGALFVVSVGHGVRAFRSLFSHRSFRKLLESTGDGEDQVVDDFPF